MGFKRIGSLYNVRKKDTANVFDIEISGVLDVVYNVSRQKVYGDGLNAVRKEIFKAVEKGFKEIGVYSKFDEETLKMLDQAYISKTMSEKLSEELIDKINKLLPAVNPYPETIYKEISQELNINEFQVRRHIRAMIFLEKIEKKQ